MAKRKGKKFKVHGSLLKCPSENIVKDSLKNNKKKLKIKATSTSQAGPSSSSMFVPDVTMTAVVATSSTIAHNNEATVGRKKEKESVERTSGFIFMCNGKTKPECYLNRVFGLPRGQLEIVEKIKPGSKLFLFDFDSKLLYGIYEATSKGELGLEPVAFNGKFPAQVRFKIFKECLPLAEKAFKHAIKDNYHGSKFRQVLTNKQVKTLISLFRPITRPISATAATSLSNVVTPRTFPAQLPARLPLPNDSHLSGLHHAHVLPVPVFRSEQMITRLKYDQHGSDAYPGHVQPRIGVRHAQQAAFFCHSELHYLTQAHRPYLPDKPTLSVQDPHGHTWEDFHRERIAGYGSQYQTLKLTGKREIVQHPKNVVGYNSQKLPPASALHVSIQTHAQGELLSSYQPHYPVISDMDLCQAYADPLQSCVSGRSSLVEANLSTHPQGELLSSHQPHYSVTSSEDPCQPSNDPLQRSLSGRSSLVEASLSTDAQKELLSSYQPNYHVTSNEDLHRTYVNPVQRPVSGSSRLVEASFLAPAHYSLAGAASTYH